MVRRVLGKRRQTPNSFEKDLHINLKTKDILEKRFKSIEVEEEI